MRGTGNNESRPDNWLLLEAWLWLALARLMVLSIPFRWVTRSCGAHMCESPYEIPEQHKILVARVGRAMSRARYRTPWNSNCLAQGIAAQRMLRRRGVASTLYLGVAKSAQEGYMMHAWLRSGEQILTGGGLRHLYTPILSLAPANSPPP